jgi:hypothetical protein
MGLFEGYLMFSLLVNENRRLTGGNFYLLCVGSDAG